MGVLRHRHHHHHHHFNQCRFLRLSTITALTLLLFASASASAQLTPTQLRGQGSVKSGVLEPEKRLAGPGSSPPTCRWKCGRCAPCKPVHVPIQPGLSIPLEYYPEAWRCECGNKLFMP
ncbi:EPIDERMAL PATTERNING FACTOR-like protein [Parasponia andersonii]|uniref:Epidermal patterning factor-like protein n=1 Tax=Parasponia andersonii TaxID=3476 RepID=A0A2P5E373_PARAD|nr:EPIDERMAL PATTERNING FACTOR-like protein [Parasponia andersonii]